MPDMQGLNIIVAVAEGRRLYAALEAGMAAAALGRPVRIFLQGEAAALLRDPVCFAGDEARRAAGQQIGRAHVRTPVTNAHLVCSLLLETTNKQATTARSVQQS